MYQNFNSYSPKKIKRAYYVQGRCGTKAEDCFSFIYHYKCLRRKKKEPERQREKQETQKRNID